MTTSAFLVSIQNTVFANLINSSALYYYGSVYSKLHDNTQRTTYLWIKNITVTHNTGFGYLKTFHIVPDYFPPLHSLSNDAIEDKSKRLTYTLLCIVQ